MWDWKKEHQTPTKPTARTNIIEGMGKEKEKRREEAGIRLGCGSKAVWSHMRASCGRRRSRLVKQSRRRSPTSNGWSKPRPHLRMRVVDPETRAPARPPSRRLEPA
ncbi:hypothetical protein L1887_58867 [Cichorium endivia]|nr:hypothetical protein L1887_58867 [Cichorium endivia]